MIHDWTPPKKLRKTPEAPKVQPLNEDLERVVDLIAAAKCPAIITETAGRTSDSSPRWWSSQS